MPELRVEKLLAAERHNRVMAVSAVRASATSNLG